MSARAHDVLRRIDQGERMSEPDVALMHAHHLRAAYRHLEDAQRAMPVSGFGLYGEANHALSAALTAVAHARMDRERIYLESKVVTDCPLGCEGMCDPELHAHHPEVSP